jgi:hypothetical protein
MKPSLFLAGLLAACLSHSFTGQAAPAADGPVQADVVVYGGLRLVWLGD